MFWRLNFFFEKQKKLGKSKSTEQTLTRYYGIY